ncbi:MAG: hypothetical protein N3G19_03185 [Candidatus Pacearchaeota archaeon]|nr:hypothetical protein [Candidatus Pacearchaeota archaeon]
MKKSLILVFTAAVFLAWFLFLTSITKAEESAFKFEKKIINDVVAKELNVPAKFNLTIKNQNIYDDYFKIYSLVDLKILPLSPILIPAGQEKTIEMQALPLRWLKEKGMHSIEYYIKGEKSGHAKDAVLIKVLPLSEIIIVNAPNSISRDDVKITVEVINKENIDLGEAWLFVWSDFFTSTKIITLKPKSSQNVTLDIQTDKAKIAKAGTYKLRTTFFLNNEHNYTVESDIILQEYSNITTSESLRIGFFSIVKTITKKNGGNVPRLVTVDVIKSRLERAFSTFNIQPTEEKLSFTTTTLIWQRELEPGESFTVEITTDYTLLVVILAILIIATVSLYLAKRPRVIVKKKAIKVKTKGGEFALKIIVFVKNISKEIKDVVLIDRLPHVTKLYEKFTTTPDKIEHNKLEWKFGSLIPGEERVVSYIIYSKVIPVGSIEIPRASITYTDFKERKKFALSNRLFVAGGAVE